MIYNMKLYNAPFEMIKRGEKTIELRLNDDKRRKLLLGDTIIFTNTESGEKLQAEVLELYKFKNFKELYENMDMSKCGYKNGDDISYLHMNKYYSEEEQSKYGVLGIEIRLIQ